MTMKQLSILLFITLYSCHSSDRDSAPLVFTDTNKASKTIHSKSFDDTTKKSKFILDATINSIFQVDTIEEANKVLKLVSAFDRTSIKLKKDTFIVYEKTTEGCEIVVDSNKTMGLTKIYGTLFGEMDKSEFKFYLLNRNYLRLICAVFSDISYDKPMYEKDMHIMKTITTYEIYSKNQLISVLNRQKQKQHLTLEQLKIKKKDTEDFFNEIHWTNKSFKVKFT